MRLSNLSKIILIIAIFLTFISLHLGTEDQFKPANFKHWEIKDLQKLANLKQNNISAKARIAKLSKEDLLNYINKKNLEIKKKALKGPALVRYLKGKKWLLKEKVTRTLANVEKRQKIPFSFLHDGIEFGKDEMLYLGPAKVESTYYIMPKTNELFIDSGDESAFEMFDVSGFVEKTKKGFIIKTPIKKGKTKNAKWVEYHFERS